jgi:hypothetical protein
VIFGSYQHHLTHVYNQIYKGTITSVSGNVCGRISETSCFDTKEIKSVPNIATNTPAKVAIVPIKAIVSVEPEDVG